jgi:hypothetical protein
MDGSCSLVWYLRGDMRMSVNIFLDIPFWGTWNNHFWSWATVYFKCLVSALQDVKHHASPSVCLSSWGERQSLKAPPPPQGCASYSRRHGNLGWGVPLAIPQTSLVAEGRHWSFPCWGSFWNSNCLVQWVFAWRKIFLDNISKLLKKNLSITRVPCCLRSCQQASSVPPSSGYAQRATSPLSSAPTMAPMLSCAGDPAPLPSESGRWTRSSTYAV